LEHIINFTIIATDNGFERTYHCDTHAAAESLFEVLSAIARQVQWWHGATLVQTYTI
jgi:hypothetical protein